MGKCLELFYCLRDLVAAPLDMDIDRTAVVTLFYRVVYNASAIITLFETMAVRDLRVYMDALFGSVSHYLDASGLECDAVVHMRNGKYGLVEIKLGGKELIEKGAATLKNLAARIDTVKMSSPSFLMVLTATGNFAYRRDDGIVVCPIGCLKP